MNNFRRLEFALRKLSDVPSTIAKDFSTFATKDLRAAIDRRMSPNNRPHKPLAASTIKRKGHDHPLIETYALQSSLLAFPLASIGVALSVGVDYAVYNFETRPYFPIGSLPPSWRAEIKRLLGKVLREAIKRS